LIGTIPCLVTRHVTSSPKTTPRIARFYYRFLDEGNAANFVKRVSQFYTLPTLHRLSVSGAVPVRRGAILALTMLGNGDSIYYLGEALRDTDRAVRLIAEDGLTALWHRAGTFQQSRLLQQIIRCNVAGLYADALRQADGLIAGDAEIAEAWYQRGMARAAMGDISESLADYQHALECDPYHFPSALAMAEGYLELSDLPSAIGCLQWTLQIHPYLDYARAQMNRLQRTLRGQADR
jgi:tetratricopeptide (TPR) repeat protein